MTRSPSIREGFKERRVGAADAVIKKPTRPGTTHKHLQQASPGAVRPAHGVEAPAHPAPQRAAPVPLPISPRPPRGRHTATLSKSAPRVRFEITAGLQHRLIVLGCGPVPTRLRRKRPFLEVRALGQRYALARWAVTCDGEAVLPKSAAVVWVELTQLDATIEVIVERRPSGSRKKYGPTRWIDRRSQRPVKGRWRRPAAAV